MLRRCLTSFTHQISVRSSPGDITYSRLCLMKRIHHKNNKHDYNKNNNNGKAGIKGPPKQGLVAASILTWLGLKRDESEKLYDKYDQLGSDEAEDKLGDQDQIIETIKLGVLAMQQGDPDKAESLLHIALKLAQDLNNENGVTYIFSLLANLAFDRGDYMKAERLYKDVIQRQINRGFNEKDNSIVEMSLKIAKIYASWGEAAKAEAGFRFCIEAQETKMKSKSDATEDTLALWGMARDWYAQYLLDRGRHGEAFNQFQEAFITSCELFSQHHPQSLVLLNSLGTVCSLMGEDAKAVAYFNKAVMLARKTGSEDLPTFLVNLGMAKINLGLKSEANTVCYEAKLIAKQGKNAEVVEEADECLKLAGKL